MVSKKENLWNNYAIQEEGYLVELIKNIENRISNLHFLTRICLKFIHCPYFCTVFISSDNHANLIEK